MTKEEQKYLYEFVGNHIKYLRNKSGFSQDDLAKKLCKSRVSIVNIEKGRQHPSLHLLLDIAIIFNVKLDDFTPKKMLSDNISDRTLKQKLDKIINKDKVLPKDKFDSDIILKFITDLNQDNS